MKQIIAIILIIILILTVTACSSEINSGETASQNSESTVTNLEDFSSDVSEANQQANKVELPVTYKVPMKDIYIDAPNYQEIEQSYTELFIVHESHYVAITALIEESATDAENAHDVVFPKFQRYMQNYEGGINALNIVTSDSMTINGIDVFYFEGTLNYGTENVYDGYSVGYSFVMDGVPCEIIGSVINESQSEDLKAEIYETIEAMMTSVRSAQ